jgi:6-pyruvoyltetrahydropterin 2'-reductase
MKIRISEMFYSFQGEALYAGKPSAWIRFFGCNLECNGFGQTDPTNPETYILPFNTFDVSKVSRVEDLPVWHHGCDSSYSWSAKYKHLVNDYTEQSVADKLIDMMKHDTNPEGKWVHPVTERDAQLCFTGGEPMMWQKAMEAIVKELVDRDNAPKLITIETNATKPILPIMEQMLQYSGIDFHFAMSPKLFTVSGEKDAVKPEVIASYAAAGFSHVVKFVVNGTEACWAEVDDAVAKIKAASSVPIDFWTMPVGATKDQQEDKQVADISVEAMKRGFSVATRNHCYVFGNVIGK